MKRARDLEDNGVLSFKRMRVAHDNSSRKEDISDSSEDILVCDLPSEDDCSETDEACGSEQLFQEQLPPLYDPFNSIMFKFLSDKDLVNFARACKQTRALASNELEKRKVSASLLAVVQGNEDKVKSILEINPNLLYSKEGITTDYSGRQIQNLTLFQAALCAGDIDMLEILKKEYFSQLEDSQAEIENQFNEIFPNGIQAHLQKQKDNVFDFNKILLAIIDAPLNDVAAALDKKYDNQMPLHQALEIFREAFTEISLSEIVFNPFHLLKSLEKYDTEFERLGNWDKRHLFFRQVIGFVQRYLPACYLQAFTQGIYSIVQNKEPLLRSFNFSWGGGTILPRRDFSGLGFDFAAWGRAATLLPRGGFQTFLEIMCRSKTSRLEALLTTIDQCKACHP